MTKAKRPAKRTKRKAADPIEASISDLKKQVRKKVTNGQALSKGGTMKGLEAREIQIKIADLETKAAEASKATKKKSPIIEQKVRKQTEALKRRLKA